MKKTVALILCLLFSLQIFAIEVKNISIAEEGTACLYYTSEEAYFGFPYVKKYAKLDRSMLAVDEDGFLKFKYKDKALLIIDGDMISQYFTKFQNDGENKYSDNEKGFYNSNVKTISASSSFSENIKGRKISYTPDNLYKCFYAGSCKCHPYWWNDAHIPWVEGAKGNGIGESITVEYKEPVYGISILNGYVDINNMKLYKENSRLKQIEVEDLETGKKKTVNFEDKVYFNYISFETPLTKLKITIKDVYKGTKYTDTCVSAILDNRWDIKGLNTFEASENIEAWLNKYKNEWYLESTQILLDDFFSGNY